MDKTSRKLVLVTGANGFIASRTVEAFLEAGYNVRGTVRSVSSGEPIQGILSSFIKSGRLEIAIVPDITEVGAFDKVVEGCYAIAHLAAPVSLSFKDPVPVIHGAVVGTQTLLNSAYKYGKDLSSVAIMSSIVAIMSPREADHVYSEKDWNESSEAAVEKLGSNAASLDIYAASKIAAERAFWKFRDNNKPEFAMTSVNPALVGGPPLILRKDPKNINESVIDVYKILSGAPLPSTIGNGTMVDVRDVARLLVFTVDNPEKTNGERYLAASAAGPTQAVADILRDEYPERKSAIHMGTPGIGYDSAFDISMFLDASKAVKVTGVPWIGFRESVLAAAKAFERYL